MNLKGETDEQTELEKKISEIIEVNYSDKLKPEHKPLLDKIKLQLVPLQNKNILLIKIPDPVLCALRKFFTKFITKMRKIFSAYMIFVVRRADSYLTAKKKPNKELMEDLISNLCYPSVIKMRTTDVNLEGRLENAILERRSDFTEDDLEGMSAAFETLTEKKIRYTIGNY
ncbi:ribosomal protein S7 [Hamiltosporidium tvaerminnensis]|uniref:Ribosomal protein S7 n=2 Tax=Hamiltosporidium TaxID=1176354 RepID=A0A4V2JV57_9MICR|nr:hypothetical protein LUQ84_000758 [Hamiltosporidium tvaerminnensis]KAK1350525.1 hypothetical protein LUQ84_000762 [Hamiltosporidium tvaerminnensis]TBU02672.1 ribosomal protein S7 [Hamiltosporidium magnivora]TBU06863.1 ribosomal protein S7 [Hamiltosporidium magnivora]TBU10986.1 ribosomal protein S7 [Hamiltosporidium tvaerminnensis]